MKIAMNEAEFRKLLTTSWQRPLSPAEEARLQTWLSTHPEARGLWDEEAALNHLLDQLPDTPISSNFTARLLEALDRESILPPRTWLSRFFPLTWRGRLLPRLAGATALLAVVLAGIHLYQENHRSKLVHDVRIVGNLAALPYTEFLSDYEAIRQLPTVSIESGDLELLAALE